MSNQDLKQDKILLAHGSGGKPSADLFRQVFLSQFDNPFLAEAHDGAILKIGAQRFAFSTDSYVVKPHFFPGGNIGDLAVNGTVNDIAMCGARPLYLSAGFILEEGFDMAELKIIVQSMRLAADKAGVLLVTGDTKVVEHGSADGIFINTAGIGQLDDDIFISPQNAVAGDAIVINGRIGDHGIAVMSKREGIEFESDIVSDSASLNHMVEDILKMVPDIHVFRDPTRGGVAATLNEIAEAANVGIEIDEAQIPINDQVIAVSQMLGLDPLYIANEGKMVVFVPAHKADQVVAAMKKHAEGAEAVVIGSVTAEHRKRVVLRTRIGTRRIVDMPAGDQLPRIC
ncbi:MAG: hydrogenase expression/formation protein HypE [SAR324 cluster bacterium]|nr:hydrogenase expression/formation protein HypE [SAR324 cluster bacterium]